MMSRPGGLRDLFLPLRDVRGMTGVLLGFALALRLVYAHTYRVNNDETQHLHVVWSLLQGMVPYRDFFDNHTPLFQVLVTPLLYIVGVRADAMFFMRLFLLPIYVLILVLVHRIGRSLMDARTAWWATVLTAFVPLVYFESLEFRPDGLWGLVWTGVIAVLLGGSFTWLRAATAGAAMGAALCVSIKTAALLISLAGAGAVLLVLAWREGALPSLRVLMRWGLAMSLGFAVMPTAMCLYLVSNDAVKPFFDCVVEHNHLERPKTHLLLLLLFIPVGCVIFCQVKSALRIKGSVAGASREITLGASTLLYLPVLYNLSWKSYNQDYIPFCGPAVLLVTPWVLRAFDAAACRMNPRFTAERSNVKDVIPFSMALLVLVAAVLYRPPWKDRFTDHTETISAVLQLTDARDWVADKKGETVFRKRSNYYVLEMMTRERFRRGLIVDDIPERIVSKNTCVVVSPDGFPPRARKFILDNYLNVGPVYVVGKVLSDTRTEAGKTFAFQVPIEAEFTFVDADGAVPGTLDGSLCAGSQRLSPGSHEFTLARATQMLAVVWSRAIDRGFVPRLKPEEGV